MSRILYDACMKLKNNDEHFARQCIEIFFFLTATFNFYAFLNITTWIIMQIFYFLIPLISQLLHKICTGTIFGNYIHKWQNFNLF